MKRMKYLGLLLALVLGVSWWASGAGAAKAPQPKTKAEAEAWFHAKPDVQPPASIQATPASPDDAAAAAALPGADVEGVAPTETAAKGDTIAPQDAEGGGGSVCWQAPWNLSQSWGSLTYERHVNEYRYWCTNYLGGPQTYRVSYVQTSSIWCSSSNQYAIKFSGGNGYTWTTVETGANFSCPTPWYWSLNSLDWQRWSCNTWGNCARVASGER